ncbi:hypothetical protein Tco_1174967, partial [Tanacetum coccineum]
CEKRLKDSASFCEFCEYLDIVIGNNVRPIDPSKVASEDLTTGDEGASCFSCALPDAPIGKMYQPSWDGWFGSSNMCSVACRVKLSAEHDKFCI